MKHSDLTLKGLERLARDLYKKSGPGQRIFGLVGPLGAGKTAFVKALASHMGIKKAKSPTFTVVHCYQKGAKSLYHVDLYRLDTARQLDAIGLDEMLADEDSLVAIEWADKFPKLMSKCDLVLKFQVQKNKLRNVTVTRN